MKVFRDSEDELWIDVGEDELVAMDEPLRRRIREKWPTRTQADLEKEFGKFRELQ